MLIVLWYDKGRDFFYWVALFGALGIMVLGIRVFEEAFVGGSFAIACP
jgi:hypothetical protein